MSVDAAAGAIHELLGADAAVVLEEAGLSGWQAALAAVPASSLQAALSRKPPGFALLLVVRERLAQQPDLRPAVAVTRALIRWLGDRLGPEHPDTLAELGMLGVLAERSGRRDRALGLLEQAWEGLNRAGAPERAAAIGRRLAELLVVEGRPEEAVEVIEGCWQTLRGAPSAGAVGLQRAELYHRLDRPLAAAAAAREAWAAHVAGVGEAHASTPGLGLGVGRLLIAQRQLQEAAAPLRVAVARGQAVSWPGWVEAAFLLVQALEATGIGDEALRTVEDALRRARAAGAVPSAWLALAARVMAARGRATEAEGLLFEAMEVDRRAHGSDSAELAQRQAAYGRFLLRQGRIDESLGWLEPAVAALRKALPLTHEAVRAAAEDLVTALVARRGAAVRQGDRDAAAWCDAGLRGVVPNIVPADHPALRG